MATTQGAAGAAPAATINVPCRGAGGGAAGLVGAVDQANASPGPDTINLAGGCSYVLTAADNPGNGLPVVTGQVSIRGNGATIRRSSPSPFRIFDVGPGANVNLEPSLRAGEPVGGHLVQGHVDGVGTIAEVTEDGFARRVRIEASDEILRYVVATGSIAVDGVSLTVAGLDAGSFTVSLIPETLARTNLGAARPGSIVNLEVDVLAKYVEKALASRKAGPGS
ncbi:MAG: riboflavin synthase [Candidatus Aeolococcus gillhamiae]|uniref:Riboflavin synthase n=1 Tax=Candidatus Aeolococcus gillhamiae TaxID=3127015 RepID=A0A2W5Z3L9_9BACT|nr:MAG: riboflavin synthase [Candidatus Dormibacter sp. RRmetagenome_bin12]